MDCQESYRLKLQGESEHDKQVLMHFIGERSLLGEDHFDILF